MSEELITKLANDIINQAIFHNYKFYLIVLVISVVSSFIVAFSGSYLRKKGENYATKKDFDDILDQLKETTSATEEIKATIAAKQSLEEETRKLLRDKLEQIFHETYKLELWLERTRGDALSTKAVIELGSNPMATMELLQTLYFDDCRDEVRHLRSVVDQMLSWCLNVQNDAFNAARAGRTLNVDNKPFHHLYPKFRQALDSLRTNLIEKYAHNAGLREWPSAVRTSD